MNLGVLHEGVGPSYWVVGDFYTILASGDDTGGAYALIRGVVPAGGRPPPHLHRREDEAFYVLQGDLTFQADGQAFAAKAEAGSRCRGAAVTRSRTRGQRRRRF